MVLTEPQAGSDLALIRTRAVPDGDHLPALRTEDLHHLGRSRLHREHHSHGAGAHRGRARRVSRASRSSSCRRSWWTPTARSASATRCAALSIEHKLGIHASPTCVLGFGEERGAIGYLIGKANRGPRVHVHHDEHRAARRGARGLCSGGARFSACRRVGAQSSAGPAAAVCRRARPAHDHPSPRCQTHDADDEVRHRGHARARAVRRLSSSTSRRTIRTTQRRAAARRRAVDLLIPIVKGWCTEFGNELAAVGMQVHGGMGFIEETGAAQYVRDLRITAIYEGTTGIQSNDLIGRKIGRDRGAAMQSPHPPKCGRELEALEAGDAVMQEIKQSRRRSRRAVARSDGCASWKLYSAAPEQALAVSVPYLKLCGTAIGGWLLARSAAIAAREARRRGARVLREQDSKACASTCSRSCLERWRWHASCAPALRAWQRPTPR